MSMTAVEAITMRATSAPLPAYGASSSRSNFSSQAPCVTSPSGNLDDRRFADSEQIGGRMVYADTNRIFRGQVHPVQRTLHLRKTGLQGADAIRIRRHAETDAFHGGSEAHVGLGHDIDVGAHARCDELELALAEVRHGPPGARVDEVDLLRPAMAVTAL